MSQNTFIATAGTWNVQYGLRISREVRDSIFRKKWKDVELQLGAKTVSIRLSPSFWNKCHELRSAEIGRWLKAKNLAKWPHGNPPKFKVQHLGDNRFKVIGRA